MATDVILYPTQLEVYSLEGLKQSMSVLRDYTTIRSSFGLPSIEVLGIVPTMTSLRTTEHRANLLSVGKIKVPVFDPIPSSTIWASATATQRSIFAYDPTAPALRHAERFLAQCNAQLNANA